MKNVRADILYPHPRGRWVEYTFYSSGIWVWRDAITTVSDEQCKRRFLSQRIYGNSYNSGSNYIRYLESGESTRAYGSIIIWNWCNHINNNSSLLLNKKIFNITIY